MPVAIILISTRADFWKEDFQITEGRTAEPQPALAKGFQMKEFLNKVITKTLKMTFHV